MKLKADGIGGEGNGMTAGVGCLLCLRLDILAADDRRRRPGGDVCTGHDLLSGAGGEPASGRRSPQRALVVVDLSRYSIDS
jgi:hypothetical protein